MYRCIIVTASAAIAFAINTGQAAAHPHETGPTDQVLANGQDHPGFQLLNDDGLRLSCEGFLEPATAGPAGYGLETAHHGPDAGDPGKADGCYAVLGNPQDNNPAID